ncbi:MAG: flagellar assembly protein FliH [Psychromonas sp.]|nr:flagellar assembly protein FliH [Psychromonas sp.]
MITDPDDFDTWNIPDLIDDIDCDTQVSSLFGNPAKWYTQDNNKSSPKKDLAKPLSLNDVEAIRQSAYDDGFNEGKEAGFAQGLEKGTEEGIKQGIENGFAIGEQQGLDEAKIRIDVLAKHWESLIVRLHCPLEKLDDNVEYQLVNLATALVEQITRCEVEQNSKVILQALKQGVEALPVNEQILTILLHPDDLSIVQQVYSAETCLQRKWIVQAEPTLSRGDCQIHTQTSSIDYTFDSRIKQILSQFFRHNYNNIPKKNNDSNLLNDEPMIATSETDPSELAPEISETKSTTNQTIDATTEGEANE